MCPYPASQAIGQFATGKAGDGAGAHFDAVADPVELDVAFNILGEMDTVAGLARKEHERVWIELPRLVLTNLHQCDGRHGLGIVRRDGKVLACDAKECIHCCLCVCWLFVVVQIRVSCFRRCRECGGEVVR